MGTFLGYDLEHPSFPSRYPAIVADIQDPKQLKRLRFYCLAAIGSDDKGNAVMSNWALPVGMATDVLPDPGQLVWASFQSGDPNYPLWEWGSPAMPIGLEETASSFRGVPSRSEVGGGDAEMPSTNFNPQYGQVHTIPFGPHKIEMDKTPGSERVKIFHGSGAWIEIAPDGGIRIYSKGPIYEKSESDSNKSVINENETVKKNSNRSIRGALTETVGRIDRTVTGQEKESLGEVIRTVTGSITESIGGSLTQEIMNNHDVKVGGGHIVMANSILQHVSCETAVLTALGNGIFDDPKRFAKPGARPTGLTVPILDYKSTNGWARFAAAQLGQPDILGAQLLLDPIGAMSELSSTVMLSLLSQIINVGTPTATSVNLAGILVNLIGTTIQMTAANLALAVANISVGLPPNQLMVTPAGMILQSPNLMLGSATAVSPIPRGDILWTKFNQLVAVVHGHTHVATSPTGPVAVAPILAGATLLDLATDFSPVAKV